MARGWESKSVEDQISAKETAAGDPARLKRTPEEIELEAKREGLQMARTRTLASLQSACDSRYRAHLERVLADLDGQIVQSEARISRRKTRE
jgi:hypothetical protein